MESSLSHSSEKIRRGTLLCFTNFLMSKKIIDKRGGGGEYLEFRLKNLPLTVPIKNVG